MPRPLVFSIIESPLHPKFSDLYEGCGYNELRFNSMRKALSALKQHNPKYLFVEFFYGYGNNYAGANISNLDVLLRSLQKYSPESKVVVFVDKKERQYIEKLEALFPLYQTFTLPVRSNELLDVLK